MIKIDNTNDLKKTKDLNIGKHFYYGNYFNKPIEWIKLTNDRAISSCIFVNLAFGWTSQYINSNVRLWCNTLCQVMNLNGDMIYIASKDELENWFPDDKLRKCEYSTEAKNRGDKLPYYWTSTPANEDCLNSLVGYVHESGIFNYASIYCSSIGVRPALKLEF